MKAINKRLRKPCGTEDVFFESLKGYRSDQFSHPCYSLCIFTDFILGMSIQPQMQEMEQIVQIYLPIPLGICT